MGAGGMKILVCGGRDFLDKELLDRTLDEISMQAECRVCIIHGDSRGADKLAGQWADVRGVPVMVFPANWQKFGRSGGPIRNEWMLKWGEPDLVVAFPGGRGTANMVKLAVEAAVAVQEIS